MLASAPGKVIISGEHSVVYGKHAIVTAINLRCYVNVKKANRVKITSELGETGIDFEVHPYVSWAIKLMEKKAGKNLTPEIRIKSDLPVASGLGSSAAVTVATVYALCKEYELEFELEDVYEVAKEVELKVQGKASGIDPFVSTYGGSWLMPEKERFNFDSEILLVDTEEKGVTAEMVRRVYDLRKRYPELVDGIFDVMDMVTLKIKEALESKDYESIFELFRMNQSMLKAIGVSTEKIDEITSKLERLGYPAKITGAGGGGCVLSINPGKSKKLEEFKVISTKVISTIPETEGVREEVVQ